MTRNVRAAATCGLLAGSVAAWIVLAHAQGQTPPGQAAAPAKPATALVVGQLVDGSSGAPVSSALITITRSGTAAPPLPPVYTDGSGRFVFHSLPAGAYGLAAERPGYISSQYGQGRRIELTDGQRLTNVTMRMWKYASISGRLFDEAGEPVIGATLRIVRAAGPANARRFSEGNSDQTDDLGAYRFSQLPPGDYVVMLPSIVQSVPLAVVDASKDADETTGGRDNPVRRDLQASGSGIVDAGRRMGDQLVSVMATQLSVGADGTQSVYPTTFYPGVRQVSAAGIVTVKSGEERTGLDFGTKMVPAVSVSGKVIGPDGPGSNMAVMLIPAGAEALAGPGPSSFGLSAEAAVSITRADGSFTAPIVPAGDYTASVLKIPVPPRPAAPDRSAMTVTTAGGGTASFGSGASASGVPADPVLWGRRRVTVGDRAIDGVTIQLARGATVSGRIEFEAGTAPLPTPAELQRMRIALSPVEGQLIGRADATIASDRSFVTRGYPPGRYRITLSAPTPAWTLKSVLVGGRDVREAALEISGLDATGVVMTFTDKAGEISGTVTKTAADGDAGVLLLPADYQSWVQRGMDPRAIRSAQWRDGVYHLTGVLAGEYTVVAVSVAAGSPDVQNPQTVASLIRQGTRVTIGERENRTLPLTLVTVRQP